MFSFLKRQLHTIYTSFATGIKNLLGAAEVNDQTLQELEKVLLSADMGVPLTRELIGQLRQAYQQGSIQNGHDAKIILEQALSAIVLKYPFSAPDAHVYLLVGINGSGKTTCAAKLAHRMQQEGKRVLLVAADTFRAAAVQQLATLASKLNIDIIAGESNQDPAAVVFTGCKRYQEERYDILIIDTAGRLQTKINLMRELEKIKRVITKTIAITDVCTLLTVDAMLGQNSFEQARLFHESTHLDGLILTKMDGTGKGGIVFSITHTLHIPVAYIACGEKKEDLYPFDPHEYVKMLLS